MDYFVFNVINQRARSTRTGVSLLHIPHHNSIQFITVPLRSCTSCLEFPSLLNKTRGELGRLGFGISIRKHLLERMSVSDFHEGDWLCLQTAWEWMCEWRIRMLYSVYASCLIFICISYFRTFEIIVVGKHYFVYKYFCFIPTHYFLLKVKFSFLCIRYLKLFNTY